MVGCLGLPFCLQLAAVPSSAAAGPAVDHYAHLVAGEQPPCCCPLATWRVAPLWCPAVDAAGPAALFVCLLLLAAACHVLLPSAAVTGSELAGWATAAHVKGGGKQHCDKEASFGAGRDRNPGWHNEGHEVIQQATSTAADLLSIRIRGVHPSC